MSKLFFLVFAWGPAMLGFSLGWLIHHPADWTGPAVIGPLGAVLTFATYRWGFQKLKTVGPELRDYVLIGMISSALVGGAIFVMLGLRMIG